MFHPVGVGRDANRLQTRYLLAPGGRVFWAEHDPSANDRLIVPTESELKTILYEQAGGRAAVRDNRVSIDYVALQAGKSHAMPTCHRNKRTSREQRGIVNTGGSLHTVKALAKPARQPLDHERSYGGGGSGGHHSRASDRLTSPCTDESGENDGVSLFLDYFSAFSAFAGKPTDPEGTTASSNMNSKREPAEKNRQIRRVEHVDLAEATLEISKPLANVDLYHILARAPLAEPGTPIPRRGGGLKAKSKRVHNGRGNKRVAGHDERRNEPRPANNDKGYAYRDPLRDEVEILRVKITANFLRIKHEAEAARPPAGVDITHDTAILVSRATSHPAGRESPTSSEVTTTAKFDGILPQEVQEETPLGKAKDGGRSCSMTCYRIESVPGECSKRKERQTRSSGLQGFGGGEPIDATESASEYGEESFECADGAVEAGLKAVRPSAENEAARSNRRPSHGLLECKEIADAGFEGVVGRADSSCSASDGQGLGRVTDSAAATKIQACWKGFLGRWEARTTLQIALHKALRTLGGGRLSKVMALADLQEGDQRGLNQALRIATESRFPRRHLPEQGHILDCVRFVERLHRRRAQVVNARKRRWTIERARRKEHKIARALRGGVGVASSQNENGSPNIVPKTRRTRVAAEQSRLCVTGSLA